MIKGIRLLLLFVVVAFLNVACAGSSGYMKSSETLLTPTNEKALVRFMRPSGIGYAINFNIWDGEKVIGNSVAKSQFDYLADPGKHLFVSTAENVVFLEAEVEAGKVYYILSRVKMGLWKARTELVPVTKGSEYWDEVKVHEKELVKLAPDTAAIQLWEAANKDKIKAVLSDYETKLKNEEQWPKLNREDGR